MRIVVVFPEPFRPMRAKTDPRGTRRSTSRTAGVEPKYRVSKRASMTGGSSGPRTVIASCIACPPRGARSCLLRSPAHGVDPPVDGFQDLPAVEVEEEGLGHHGLHGPLEPARPLRLRVDLPPPRHEDAAPLARLDDPLPGEFAVGAGDRVRV